MTAFVVIAGLLAIGALAVVVLPLMRRHRQAGISRNAMNVAVYRDQLRELEGDLRAGTLERDQYDRSRAEIETRLLQEVGTAEETAPPRSERSAVAFAVALPACALLIYLLVGNPQAIQIAGTAQGPAHGMGKEQVLAMVEQLAARMRANPEDPEGWKLLARSYASFGRYKEASEAYANAAARVTNDAQLLADYADTLAMAQGHTLEGKPEKLIERALAIDPANVKALALAGTIAFNRKDYAKAVQYWERILAGVAPDSETAKAVRANIAEARANAGGALASAAPTPAPQASGTVGRVSGIVKLAPALAGKVEPTDTVFIFAHAANGPRMPLAILRRQVSDLPIEFALDDSMAMTPQMKLSSFPQVVIGARVSKSANAMPQPGDLEGSSEPIKVGANDVNVVIDSVVR